MSPVDLSLGPSQDVRTVFHRPLQELSLGENAQHSPLSSLSHQTVPHSLPSVDVAVTPHRTVTPSKNQGDSGALEASVLPSII